MDAKSFVERQRATAAARRHRKLVKDDFHIRALLEMHRVDETDLAIVEYESERMRSGAFSEEAHATQQAAAGDSRAGENDFLARRQCVWFVDSRCILDSQLRDALMVLRLRNNHPCQDFAIETAQCRGRKNAF